MTISETKYYAALQSAKTRCKIVMSHIEYKKELTERKKQIEEYLIKESKDGWGGIKYLYYRIELDRINECLYGYIDKNKFVKTIII